MGSFGSGTCSTEVRLTGGSVLLLKVGNDSQIRYKRCTHEFSAIDERTIARSDSATTTFDGTVEREPGIHLNHFGFARMLVLGSW